MAQAMAPRSSSMRWVTSPFSTRRRHSLVVGEALQMMVAGERRRLWVPEKLGYQDGRGPKGMLVYDVELVGIYKNKVMVEHK